MTEQEVEERRVEERLLALKSGPKTFNNAVEFLRQRWAQTGRIITREQAENITQRYIDLRMRQHVLIPRFDEEEKAIVYEVAQ